jgi:hypothetical protein
VQRRHEEATDVYLRIDVSVYRKSTGRWMARGQLRGLGAGICFSADYHQQCLAKDPDGYCGIGGCGVPFKVAELGCSARSAPEHLASSMMPSAARSFFEKPGFRKSSLSRMRPRQTREFDERRVADGLQYRRHHFQATTPETLPVRDHPLRLPFNCSSMDRVLSVITSPVCAVDFRSTRRM